jgi:hypothetical protein
MGQLYARVHPHAIGHNTQTFSKIVQNFATSGRRGAMTKDDLEALLAKMRAAYAAGNIEEAVALAKRAAPFVHEQPAPIVLTNVRKRA